MTHSQVRCPRCGYAPIGPPRPGLKAGGPCPQCAAPLEAASAPPPPPTGRAHTFEPPPGFDRPKGLEDRHAAPGKVTPAGDANFGALFARAIDGYRARGWSVVGAAVAGAALTSLSALPFVLLSGAALPPDLAIPARELLGRDPLRGLDPAVRLGLLAAAIPVALFLSGWGVATFAGAVAEPPRKVGESLRAALPRAWSFGWTLGLAAFAITGGAFLLLVPGLLLALHLSFAPWAILEGQSGLDALARSRALVRGREVAVLVRLLAVGALGAILGAIAAPLRFVYAPFAALFHFALFDALRAGERRTAALASPGEKGAILATGVLGWAAPVLLLLSLSGGSIPAMKRNARLLLEGALRGDLQGIPLSTGAGSGDPAAAGTFTPAGGFEEVRGDWEGGLVPTGGAWRFRFSSPFDVEGTGPGGERIRGEGRVYWERGADDGLSVLPGGYPLDLADTSAPGPARISLGSFRRQGDRLELCLGRPGGLVRTSDFGTTDEIRCWRLRPSPSGP